MANSRRNRLKLPRSISRYVFAVVIAVTTVAFPISIAVSVEVKPSGINIVPDIIDRVKRRDRKSTRLNSSHIPLSRMPSSA